MEDTLSKGERASVCRVCQCLGAVPDRREDKERKVVDKLTAPEPSWHCQNLCFDLPTGEGAPQGFEGLGSLINGVWGKVPQWVWATPKVWFFHARHGSAKPTSVADPYRF